MKRLSIRNFSYCKRKPFKIIKGRGKFALLTSSFTMMVKFYNEKK